MIHKTVRRLWFAPTLAMAVAVAALPAQAETLKLTSCLQRNHDFVEAFFKTFVEPINAKGGDLKLNYLGGPEVTPFQKQGSALQRGLVDMIVCPAPYYSGQLNEARLTGLQNKSLDEIRANGAWDMMQEAWNKGLNARILAWTHFGGQTFYLYTSFQPKQSTETGLDLTGVKMRSTPLYNPLLKAMGATTVVISPSDVYTSLERGLVQGLGWPWGSIAQYGWERFLKYRISPSFYGATQMTLVNLEKWKTLSKSQRDLLESQARIYERDGDPIIVKKAEQDDAKLRKAGVKTIQLEGKVRQAYLATIYEAKWAENDKLKYIVDYEKLKSKLYARPGS